MNCLWTRYYLSFDLLCHNSTLILTLANKEVFQLPGVEAAKKYIETAKFYSDMQARLLDTGAIFLNRKQRNIRIIHKNQVIPKMKPMLEDAKKYAPINCTFSEKDSISVDSGE